MDKTVVHFKKHKWADEVALEKTEKRKKFFVIAMLCVAFLLGASTSYLAFGNTGNSTISQSGNYKFESIYNLMKTQWFFSREYENADETLTDAAIRGMVDSQGDAHTYYMSCEEMSDFSSRLENSIVGIGIRYQFVDDSVLVKEILADSPAQTVDLRVGDRIVEVDGVSCALIGSDAIVDTIRGKEGTKVIVTVQRGNDTFKLTITRAQVYTSVTSEVLNGIIGYVNINSFGSATAEELANHLNRMEEQGVKKLIVDLRDNGGGYLSTLLKMSSFFMPSGTVVIQEEMRDGTIQLGKTSGKPYDFSKIVILVNENSASCSEVFAIAMREQIGATLVGTTTYGKGTVQVTQAFSDGSALKYTTARWLSPSGISIHGTGVTPDVEVRLDDALYLSYFDFALDEVYGFDSVDELVKNAQIMLRFLGYQVDRIDGYFDASTVSAIKQFQKAEGIEVSGQLDHESAKAFNTAVSREWGSHQKELDSQWIRAMEIVNE